MGALVEVGVVVVPRGDQGRAEAEHNAPDKVLAADLKRNDVSTKVDQ